MSVTVITGKQNSGKSLRAEELTFSYGKPLFYLATMKVMDDEGRKRVEKHRRQREGKGFVTIECEYGIRKVPDMIMDYLDAGEQKQSRMIGATILLECATNLVGNELYDNPDRSWSDDPMKVVPEEFVRVIMDDIRYLADRAGNLVIVSGEYELNEDADEGTRLFIKLLDMVNRELQASFTDPCS